MNIETRTAQVLAVTEQERDEVDENNPIIHAETGPNRFTSITWFFPEEDGVRVQEDLDLNIITVYYFNDEGETELTEGALYEWAKKLYEED